MHNSLIVFKDVLAKLKTLGGNLILKHKVCIREKIHL